MHQYMNEDEAWQRLQDIQREMENRRLMAAGRPHATLEMIRQVAARAWLLAGLAAMRPPRRRPASVDSGRGGRRGSRRDREHRSHAG